MSLSEFAESQFYMELKKRLLLSIEYFMEEYGLNVVEMREILRDVAEGFGKCPKCQKLLEVVAQGTDYYVVGCPEHREYDEVHTC